MRRCTVERGRPRRKAPPLPINDMKIIIRPKSGLAIRELRTREVSRAIVQACGRPANITGDDFLLRIRPGSYIVIASTPE